MLTLTVNNSQYKENLYTLTSQIMIIKETTQINLEEMAKILNYMGITRLTIFYISNIENINRIAITEPSEIFFIEINEKLFIEYLNNPQINFLDYNLNSLYIIEKGTYIKAKSIFSSVNGHKVNLSRGASQKGHIISPLHLRFMVYIMALFNCNYKKICYFNLFNNLDKNKFLPYFKKK